jgi:hypothetical protein
MMLRKNIEYSKTRLGEARVFLFEELKYFFHKATELQLYKDSMRNLVAFVKKPVDKEGIRPKQKPYS